MANRMSERMSGRSESGYREMSAHGGSRMSNMMSMVRRRPVRSALIGAGLALAMGMMQARRRGRRAGSDNQYGWTGHESGMAYRGAEGTRDAKKRMLLAWLNNAYSMERSVANTLKGHAHAAKDHPAIQARLERHVEESHNHAEMVKDRIERLGGHVSALKAGMGTVMGAVQGVITAPARDELVKNLLADSAAERLEIASYRGIITAADEIGDIETAQVARQILKDEEAMSDWLEQQLPAAVRSQMAEA